MDANYNLNGLVGRIRARLKDEEYSETDIKQFINDAYFEILGEAHYQFLEKYYRQQTQKSGEMLLPPDFQSLIRLTSNDGKNTAVMQYMPSADYLKTGPANPSKNYYYTIFGNNLFYTLPDVENQENEDGEEKFYSLNLFYLAKPTALTADTDVPVIPAEFGEALLLRALARCEQIRDNFDYAAIYENKADELIINLKERYCPRNLTMENRANLPVDFRARY